MTQGEIKSEVYNIITTLITQYLAESPQALDPAIKKELTGLLKNCDIYSKDVLHREYWEDTDSRNAT